MLGHSKHYYRLQVRTYRRSTQCHLFACYRWQFCRARHFMQLHILHRKSPFCLQISLFAFFAKLLKLSRKFEKWSYKWCKSAVKHKFRLNFDTSSKNITSDDKNDKQILRFIKTCTSGLSAQHFSLFAEKLYFWHKICKFAQNLSFCTLWSPFLPFWIVYFP